MPTIEGKDGKLWIDAYVKKAGKFSGVAKMVRALVKKTAVGCEEYVSPWKTPAFDSNGPLCVWLVQKEYVTLAFLRGAALPDPEIAEFGGREASRSEAVDCGSGEIKQEGSAVGKDGGDGQEAERGQEKLSNKGLATESQSVQR